MKAHSTTYKITATTLTPLHIGSGRELQFNTDYLYFGLQKAIGVIEPEKLLQLIGPENIDTWVGYINQRKGVDEYIRNVLKKNAAPEQFSSRLIAMRGTPVNQQNVKEQLHNGTGRPYVPGSSIKGALRTALLTILIAENPDFVKEFENLTIEKRRGKDVITEFKDSAITRNYIGQNPNHDFMRLLRVGDLHFETTECNLVKTINLTHKAWRFKNEINQFVECIPSSHKSQFTIQLFNYGSMAGNLIHNNRDILFGTDFFDLINQHTERWIYNELVFWENEDRPEIVEPYYENLVELRRKFDNLQEGELMLKVGFGGGFASLTGDWQPDNMTEEDYNELVFRMRHPKYEGFKFPKTRKFTESMQPLGFLLLKIQQ